MIEVKCHALLIKREASTAVIDVEYQFSYVAALFSMSQLRQPRSNELRWS